MHELKILLHEPEFQNCKIIVILNEVEPYYTFGNKPTSGAARTEEEDFKQRKEKFMERLNFDFLLGNLKFLKSFINVRVFWKSSPLLASKSFVFSLLYLLSFLVPILIEKFLNSLILCIRFFKFSSILSNALR